MNSNQIVKIKGVSITVYPWRHSSGRTHWRFAWYDLNGGRRYTTRAEKSAAITAARNKAREIHNGTMDLGNLSDDQARLCRAFLDLSPDWSLIERLRAESNQARVIVHDAFDQFIESKKANAGSSPRNVSTLKNRLGHLVERFGDSVLSDVLLSDLDKWLAGGDWQAGTKLRIRSSVVTFFRWCRSQGHLPDRTTEAEKMTKPIVIKKAPSTYSPADLSTMLEAVRDEFRPWLILSAWAGIRREEMYPSPHTKKDVLRWEDIDLERAIITIRPEVSKTNERRIIPISSALSAELSPLIASGRVTARKSPTDAKNGKVSETSILGDLVGGWKSNALRHSFVSYRCALVGVGKAAMEAGNSEAETRRSYRDAKSEAEAAEWFELRNS